LLKVVFLCGQRGGDLLSGKLESKDIPINWLTSDKEERRKAEKEKIRKAYTNNQMVEIIPAKRENTADEPKLLRVAAYCRVSTDSDSQSSSYELQIQHYTNYINKHPSWVFVDIYADEGLSATTVENRPEFLRMIRDCEAGKIDIILTKSVSRFMRNARHCLSYVYMLQSLNPLVEVRFESNSLHTLDKHAGLMLALLASVAQSESEAKSEAITWAIRNRFKNGLPLIPTWAFLGYDKDSGGNLIINKEQARTVRLIYRRFLAGKSVRQIAAGLTDSGIVTIQGRVEWSAGSVRNILRNEKYCGDVLMQKTFTPDCLTHKSVRNTGQERQYYIRDHHPAIIPREKWDEVQEQLKFRRFARDGNRKPLRIRYAKAGILAGFFVLNTAWDAYDAARVFAPFLLKETPESNKNEILK